MKLKFLIIRLKQIKLNTIYKHILSIFGCLFIKFNNTFVFPDPESPIINIPYGWSGTFGQFGLCFSFEIESRLNIFVLFHYIITLIFFFLTY